jgi:hypothetical protein
VHAYKCQPTVPLAYFNAYAMLWAMPRPGQVRNAADVNSYLPEGQMLEMQKLQSGASLAASVPIARTP